MGIKVWTKEEEARLVRLYPVLPDDRLELEFPRFKKAHIKTKAWRMGIRKKDGRWSPEDLEDLLVLWDGMESMPMLVKRFNRNPQAIIRRYYKLLAQRKGQSLLQ